MKSTSLCWCSAKGQYGETSVLQISADTSRTYLTTSLSAPGYYARSHTGQRTTLRSPTAFPWVHPPHLLPWLSMPRSPYGSPSKPSQSQAACRSTGRAHPYHQLIPQRRLQHNLEISLLRRSDRDPEMFGVIRKWIVSLDLKAEPGREPFQLNMRSFLCGDVLNANF